jgi:hypothetical protein
MNALSATMFIRRIAFSMLLALAGFSAVAPPSAGPVGSDTTWTTLRGNAFVVPSGWTADSRGSAVVLRPPEPKASLTLVDVDAPTADDAVAAAWLAIGSAPDRPLRVVTPLAPRDGWTDRKQAT